MCRKHENSFRENGHFCWELEEEKKAGIERNKEIELHEKKKAVTGMVIKAFDLKMMS